MKKTALLVASTLGTLHAKFSYRVAALQGKAAPKEAGNAKAQTIAELPWLSFSLPLA